MHVANASVLAALVSPTPLQQFLTESWPGRVFHGHGALSRLPQLFSSRELSSFRSLASGYRGWLGFGQGAKSSRMLSVHQVNPLHLYEIGLSVYLPDIAESVPGAGEFLRALERELGIEPGSSRLTVWASPQGDGAPTHFDSEDVFSIQLAGSKRFEVAPMKAYSYPVGGQYAPGAAPYDEMYAQLEAGFPEVVESDFQAVDMKPGSVLYIPRGTWHRTVAERDSFAISIGIHPPPLVDAFLEQLRYVLLQDPEWRRPMYGVRGDAAQRKDALDRVRRALERAPEMVRAISGEHLAPPPSPERLKSMAPDTWFQRELNTRMDLPDTDDMLRVYSSRSDAGEQPAVQMTVPPQYLPTFRWLADIETPFSAGQLAEHFPDVPYAQHQKILDVLTRANYLRLLWFPRLKRA